MSTSSTSENKENKKSPLSNEEIQTPHDRFFRSAMSDPQVALEFIQTHLPAHIVEKIDPRSLTLSPGTFISKNLRQSMTDILYKAILSGKEGYLYFLIEHQSSADPLMPLRMLDYTAKILLQHVKENKSNELPLVYPCVIYNGEKPYCHTTDIFEMFQDSVMAREIFLKPFQLIDLTQIPDEELKKKPLLGILEMFLKHAATRDVVTFFKSMAELFHQAELLKKLEFLNACAHYYFVVNQDGSARHDVFNEFQKHLLPTTQEKFMTMAEAFIEDGRKEGRQEGLQTGLERGLQKFRSFLDQQIRRRFPRAVTEKYLALINNADGETLSIWGERLMDASSIEEVFSGRPLHS